MMFEDFADKNGDPVWIAWMNGESYSRYIQTGAWRGAMTLPRSLSLAKNHTSGTYDLV